jgi:DNA polymerase I
MSTQNSSIVDILDYGPYRFGAELHIDDFAGICHSIYASPLNDTPVVIDCETDEKDNFVGLAVCYDSKNVWYYSAINDNLRKFLSEVPLIGHNLKSDAHWLKLWGFNIKPENLLHDTMLMSYVRDNARESHGLKELAQEFLSMSWPSYKQMVGKGNDKQTLDKQDIVRVANYCGTDTLATYKLWQFFTQRMGDSRMKFYLEHEMPLMRVLYEMENKGIHVDEAYLRNLKVTFDAKFDELYAAMLSLTSYKPICKKTCPKKAHVHKFNPSSPPQVKEALRSINIHVSSTSKVVLKDYTHVPFVSKLLEYKKIAKFKSTYIDAFLELPKFPLIQTTFNQVAYDASDDSWQGIRTGRLSSSSPNLQNIPSPKDEEDENDIGKLIRTCFIPTQGNTLVCADYSQIEYRLLGHFSKEPLIVEAYKNGVDIHEATGKAIGANRKLGKTINFAAIYGAGPQKIGRTANITPEQAQGFLDTYWEKLPRVTSWVKQTKLNALLNRGIKTIGGRWIPLPSITDFGAQKEAEKTLVKVNETRQKRGDRPFNLAQLTRSIKAHNERVAVNATIQGSAADVIRVAIIKLQKRGIVPNLQVHDELLFDYNYNSTPVPIFVSWIREIMLEPYKEILQVPLEVTINNGPNWEAAK